MTGYALEPPTDPSLFDLAGVASRVDSRRGDVRDARQVKAIFDETRPEIVIHMAAQALVLHSYEDPAETYATNVMGTVNVLEAVRQVGGVKAAVMVTSDKCYEDRGWVWGYREQDALGGRDPYSSSKGCAELVVSAYRRSFFSDERFDDHGVAVASARAGNVIGGGDWSEHRLIPDILKAFLDGRPVVIRNPEAVRPWQHVLDPLDGYLVLAERLWEGGPEFAGAWNFGPHDEAAKPVSWIVQELSQRWGKGAQWEMDPRPHPRETSFLKLDCSKARERFGWSAKLDLSTALSWTIDWFRAHQNNESVLEFTDSQISRYEGLGNR